MDGALASMTGSGSASVEHDTGRFEAEARSVNHRFLKTTVRTSGLPATLDPLLEAEVKKHAERGHVSVFVRFTPGGAAVGPGVEPATFARASAHLKGLAQTEGLPAPTVADVLRLPGVLGEARGLPEPVDVEAPAIAAVEGALLALREAREREGAALGQEVESLLDSIEATRAELDARAREVPEALRARLEQRLAELLADREIALDPAQLAREVALLADRADVREELARLEAHLVHAREVLAKGGALGRRLDFLVQEMHREVNTIGSKCSDLDVTRHVLALKSDVEALREQVQNLQ